MIKKSSYIETRDRIVKIIYDDSSLASLNYMWVSTYRHERVYRNYYINFGYEKKVLFDTTELCGDYRTLALISNRALKCKDVVRRILYFCKKNKNEEMPNKRSLLDVYNNIVDKESAIWRCLLIPLDDTS